MKNALRIFYFFLLIAPQFLAAQGPGRRPMPKGGLPPEIKQEVDQIRKNTYTRVLVLTDAESQKFWPVFDKMQGELDDVKKEAEKTRRDIMDHYATMSDADMENAVDKLMDLEQKNLDIKKKYYEEFKKVLPIKKVALLPRADREFKKAILERIKEYREPDGD